MKVSIFLLWMVLTVQFVSVVPCWAETNKRPFWTKQSPFMEGENLLVVGIALHAETVEEGRKRAFENAKIELMNFAQVTDLEAKGLVTETRLQGQAFEKAQRDLQLVQQTVVNRYQRLAEQDRQIQETLDSMSRLQESVREKALRFEQVRAEVEQLLQQL